jgi:hypothetical protein
MARKKGGFDWGDGKGKVHSIPRSRHRKNVKAQRRARLNDPARFTAPRGGLDVKRDAETSAGLRYGEAERGLSTQAQQVPAWFAAYRAQVAGINQGIQQGYQKAIGDVQAQAQAGAQADTTARNSLAQSMQKDAASRGATVDPALLQGDANAANVRNTNQAAFANLLSSQGQAQNSYFGGLQAAGSAAELGQRQRVSQEQQGLATDKGLYKSQYVTDARDMERKYGLERSAFGLDVAQEQNKVATARAQRKATSRNQKRQIKATARQNAETVNKYGYTNKAWHGLSTGRRQSIIRKFDKTGGKKGLTPAQRKAQKEKRSKQVTRITNAADRWNMLKNKKYDFGDGKVRAPTPSELKERLVSKEKFTPEEVHLALMWNSDKPWTAKDRKIAKRLGIKLPKKKKPVRTKQYTPGSTTPVA